MTSKGGIRMYIEEDELNDLKSLEGIHQDDVAMFLDTCESYEDLVSELKDYFKLDEKFYKEREEYRSIVSRLSGD